MDWEKQDNELRKLMQGTDFLPESENWNASKSWQQLLDLKHGTAKRKWRWLPLAVAACAAVLIGIFFWWPAPNTGPSDSVKAEEMTVPALNEGWQPTSRAQQADSSTIGEKSEMEVISTDNQLTTPTRLLVKQEPTAVVPRVIDSGASAITSSVASSATSQPETVHLTSTALVQQNPLPAADQPPLMVTKRPALKVVHYNSLNSINAVAPPVFVQLGRFESKWQTQESPESADAKQPLAALKIDLSPVPKKSL